MSRLLFCALLIAMLIFTGCGSDKGILAISPTNATVKTGQTQQFTATINGTAVSSGVNWFVNGIAGGNATVGTITTLGLYTAPATLPSPASVSISANLGSFGVVTQTNVAAVTLASSGAPINGIVVKGPLNGATVTAFAVNADGSNGASLGSSTTDSGGKFSVTAAPSSGPVRLSATGGTYISELDGTTITNAGTLSAFLDSVGTGGISGVVITPLTTEADALTVFYINNGVPAAAGVRVAGARILATATPGAAHASATTVLKGFYGITTSVTLEQLLAKLAKADITADPAGFNVGLIDGGILCLAKSIGVDPGALSAAFAKDISDGKFDGLFNKAPIVIAGAKTLPTTFPTTDFLACVSTYVSTSTSTTSAGITSSDVKPITDAMSKGVQSSPLTPTSTGLSAGSSGALSSLTFTPAGSSTSKQILFAAARSNGVAAVDITDPSTVSTGKAWPSVATTLGGQVGGVIPVTGGASHAQVFTFAYGSKKVALLNADVLVNGTPGNAADETALIDFTASLPLTATSPVGFSGGSAFVAGGIPFGGGIWLATADGYAFFDLGTKTLGKIYPIVGFLAENLGGDVPHNLLFAGNYNGVQIIDLTAAKSIVADAATFSRIQTDLGFGDTVDGDSVDSTFQVGIMTPEDASVADFLNLKTIVKTAATSSTANDTFAPGTNGLVTVNFGPTRRTFSGSALDSTTHRVLFMAGFSTDFGVGIVQDPATTPWKGLSDYVTGNLTTAFSSYNIARDPHAVGVFLNGKTGNPFGYLLDGSTHRIIQVDMNAALALPRTSGGDVPTDSTFGTALRAITF